MTPLALMLAVLAPGCAKDRTPAADTGIATSQTADDTMSTDTSGDATGETETDGTDSETDDIPEADMGGMQGPCLEGEVEIPTGSFTDTNEGPNELHQIAAICLSISEVTVAAFEACVADGACMAIPAGARFSDNSGYNSGAPGRAEHPINGATWFDADAYCAWAGGRLPTEWEWEWAARGREEGRAFPWGGTDPDCTYAVMDAGDGLGCGENTSAPVGSRSPQGDSADGVADMAGNVWEWVDSWADVEQTERILRGGSWGTSNVQALSTGQRNDEPPTLRDRGVGFRCAMPVQ